MHLLPKKISAFLTQTTQDKDQFPEKEGADRRALSRPHGFREHGALSTRREGERVRGERVRGERVRGERVRGERVRG
jgi:hypothetical protein